MALRHRSSRVVSGNRRLVEWIASADFTAFTALAGGAAILHQSISLGEPFTIVRTRGSLYVASDQIVASELTAGALGMAVVTTQAAGIGVTAVPTPIADQGSESFFLQRPYGINFGTTAAGTAAADIQGWEFMFDSKGQRKVTESETVAVLLENATLVGINFALVFRMLLKLH